MDVTGPIALVPLVDTIEPASGDYDSDGLSNGAERSAGTDPWNNDAALDPDADGLTNAQEIAIGTDPNNPDTDGDGQLDGVDLQPLVGNRRPGVGLLTS